MRVRGEQDQAIDLFGKIVAFSFRCKAEKKYAIQGPSGETLYWARETSGCGARCCLAELRPLRISVSDQTGAEVFSMRRPLNCSGCCCGFCYPHCTQKVEVVAPAAEGRTVVGCIRERATWCFPVYHVFEGCLGPRFVQFNNKKSKIYTYGSFSNIFYEKHYGI